MTNKFTGAAHAIDHLVSAMTQRQSVIDSIKTELMKLRGYFIAIGKYGFSENNTVANSQRDKMIACQLEVNRLMEQMIRVHETEAFFGLKTAESLYELNKYLTDVRFDDGEGNDSNKN